MIIENKEKIRKIIFLVIKREIAMREIYELLGGKRGEWESDMLPTGVRYQNTPYLSETYNSSGNSLNL